MEPSRSPTGSLIIIGGHEDKKENKVILSEVVRRAKGGRILVCTCATCAPADYWQDYKEAFLSLGATDLSHLTLCSPDHANQTDSLEFLEKASVLFFTGGSQRRIMEMMGSSVFLKRLRTRYWDEGLVVAGTSAGASVMGEQMIVAGNSDTTSDAVATLEMERGFGLLPRSVIDQHFAERGRFDRLLYALTHQPDFLGIGIDENSAIVVENNQFSVLGDRSVSVLDVRHAICLNVESSNGEKNASVYGAIVHSLSGGDRFDFPNRAPILEKIPTCVAS